ncbi:MAG TPA: hypothetical protein DEP36_00580 [Gammaproteobacteria bacterium]|nr:hypothetical protein [Gammaproteobacteria bacterium]HRF43640.1 poly-gamma-glutamate biosynthesis protein PgsC/CapC [Candidatus Competibacteraceae bacterium]
MIPLFPDALASSVITTVWVGVMLSVFFTLRFGWNLSGLVVPGYLTPLLLIKPLSAAVVFTEGLVTYLLVHWLSERLSRFGGWSSLFGRDRFFALVLVSVAVRLLGDGWLLPWAGQWWNQYFQQDFDYRSDLHSFGLIVVSLIANQFWKTGVRAGLPPVIVSVGLTYLIVRYGLLEFTNFSIGSLSYSYNDLATSLLATPKAYIILLTTAWIASRMNLHYGWEFNGILIPSLLALQWYDPIKILTSFTEAFIILGLARGLLAMPVIARLHLEGPRELLFFFNIAFAYKMVLGWLLPLIWPTVPVADAYGFGYLLTTLIALRMHDKDIIARLTRATLQTSLVAAGIASLAGFALTLLPGAPMGVRQPASTDVSIIAADQTLTAMLSGDHVELNRPRREGTAPAPLPGEVNAFRSGIEQLRIYLDTGDAARLKDAARQLDAAHYQIYRIEQRYLYLRERTPAYGWGIYVVDLQASGDLLVEVPAPLEERGALTAGGRLFSALQGRALAIAGAKRMVNPDRSLDVLTNRQTLFQAFHDVIARWNVLQVRGYDSRNTAAMAGLPASAYPTGDAQPPTTLWVRASLPPGLDLARLKSLVGELAVRWETTPLPNLQRDATRSGFAELVLDRSDLRRLMARATVGVTEAPLRVGELRIDGYLQEWLLAGKARIAERGTSLYRPPLLEELLYIDEEILTPLLGLIRTGYHDGAWTAEGLLTLQALANAASAVGYRLSRYQHRLSGQEYLLLAEEETRHPRRYWGAYVFRLGKGPGYLVQIPHPIFEINTLEYGLWLFEQLQADVLLLAGAHPETNPDGSADVLNPGYPLSLFSLVNQVVMREAGSRPMLAIGVRAYGIRPGEPSPSKDVLLSWHDGASRRETLDVLGQRLTAALEADGLTFEFLSGAPYAIGFQASSILQGRYLNATTHKAFCLLWLSPLVRASYRQQGENLLQQTQFEALSIPTRHANLDRQIAGFTLTAELPPQAWREALQAYVEQRDIVALRQLQSWPAYRYLRLIDQDTQMAFLLTLDGYGRLAVVTNLAPRQPEEWVVADQPPAIEQVMRFKNRQAGWLRFAPP